MLDYLDYLEDRRDLYISLAKHANDKNNSDLCLSYMMVSDEIDRIVFVTNLQFEEEK